MTSEPDRAFVWVWLPGASDPVVAGRLDRDDATISFTYGRGYLERSDRIPLYLPELPLRRGPIAPGRGEVAGCIADASPDAWGQRVILNRLVGEDALAGSDPGVMTYLLRSGSDRIGALDFQHSSEEYHPRLSESATLSELAESAARVEAGIPLSPALDQALLHGSSVGGARPKAVLRDGKRQLIAKFSSSTDTYPVVRSEFIAMRLAQRAGLDVASVSLTSALGRDALIVERFDRPETGGRSAMVSAMTILELDELSAIHDASYANLADEVRARFTNPHHTLRELFARITFNILVGNNDDHARNHSAFWDGQELTLTPAYDIAPQPRGGGETRQLMAIGRDGYRWSQVAGCIDRAFIYLLSADEAREIVDRQIEVIEQHWRDCCEEAGLTEVEQALLWRRAFLNPYSLEGYSSAEPRSGT